MPATHNEVSFVLEDQAEQVERMFLLTRKLGDALDRIDALEGQVQRQQESLATVTGNLSRALDRLDRDEASIATVTRNLSRTMDRLDEVERNLESLRQRVR